MGRTVFDIINAKLHKSFVFFVSHGHQASKVQSLGYIHQALTKLPSCSIILILIFLIYYIEINWSFSFVESSQTYPKILHPIFQGNACIIWRRFANLFETSQSLFWASFGLVSLTDFELTGIKEFTRFWALLMFGSYSVCNLIVLLNMLIAMMSNSYQVSWVFIHYFYTL